MCQPSVSAETAEAYRKGNAVLESLCLATADGSKIQVKLLKDASGDMRTALSLEGLSPWLEAVNSHHSPTYRHSLTVAGIAGLFAEHLGVERC